jgi:glycosyltransferase involved in cell wall biosynthesis
MVDICAVIPAYNEAPHIAAVVAGTRPHVTQVIVVDDGSTDGTGARAREAGAVVVTHARNQGKGAAVRTGLNRALDLPCTHVLLIDADRQHDPTEIPLLVRRASEKNADLVVGERELRKDAMPAARYYSNVIGSWILSRFIGATVADSQSGFRLLRADRLRTLRLTARGYEIETEMLIKLARAGGTLDRVTVHRLEYQGVNSKIRPFRDTFRTCMLAVKYRFLDR